jgi:DNA-binding response OmpR family regulator
MPDTTIEPSPRHDPSLSSILAFANEGASSRSRAPEERPSQGEPVAADADLVYVEDDHAWGVLVQDWAEFMGLTLRWVRSAAEFETYIRSRIKLPRCILLDIMLPGESGLSLCDRIKQSARLQCIPIILIAAAPVEPAESFRHRALHCIAKSESTKPELEAAITALLEQQERAQGVIEADGLRLDARDGSVRYQGELLANLTPNYFAAFRLLVQASPDPVPDLELAGAFAVRPRYKTPEPHISARNTLRSNISELRRILGDALGPRIQASDAGYLLRPDRFQID